jgi:hypothetical protein
VQRNVSPRITILKAALFLEDKHREAPYYETAATLSLNYLVLALRKKERDGRYCATITFLKL